MMRITSAIVWRGESVVMLVWKPALKRFTRPIFSDCSSIVWLTGRMPMPPSWAMAIAISVPVTACMAALRKGVCRRRKPSPLRHRRVVRSTLRALPSGGVYPGRMRNSRRLWDGRSRTLLMAEASFGAGPSNLGGGPGFLNRE